MSADVNGPDCADGAAGVSAAAVTVSGLTVATVRQHGTVLQDLDLRVGAAEFVGLAGESGSGKTTLGLALLGYSPPGLWSAAGTAQVHETVMKVRRRECCAAFAARRSPTSLRIRARRSTPVCGSGQASARCSAPTASGAGATRTTG